jgi:hypothetical protein
MTVYFADTSAIAKRYLPEVAHHRQSDYTSVIQLLSLPRHFRTASNS